jgi:glyoxylase-like metal-dependent hydrolase (beta-lactamase superfamily II)
LNLITHSTETDDVEPRAGEISEIAPGVRRLLAPNPGRMTGPGTNTYLLGEREVAVIDPGPPIEEHVDAIATAAPSTIKWILVTHTHPDHSPAAAQLAKITGAELLGQPPPEGPSQDNTFNPDRRLSDGDMLETSEFKLQAIHTPGHASNHLCYRHAGLGWLFTGDHIMNGSTVVINPPDGNMNNYLQSLTRLKSLRLKALAPGHGDVIDNPNEVIDWLVNHRLGREAKVVDALRGHPDLTPGQLTPFVYKDVDASLHGLAERSLLAHLIKLEEDGRAARIDEQWRLSA